MATIALYAGTINQMPWLINDAKNSVSSFKDELKDVYRKALDVDSSVCDMSDVIDSLRSSTQTQEERISKLENFQNKSEEFINETVLIDAKAAGAVNQNKNDFYKKYSYLKPECEKSGWEKFCDGLAKVGEWCKEHWKLIVTIVLVIAAVAVVILSGGTALAVLGPFEAILVGMAKGLLIGALMGGVMGGISSVAAGGSFWEGFENGAFSGAISGALMGGAMAGLGTLGATLGKGVSCLSRLGKAIKVTANVTRALSTIMGGFDTLSMMDGVFGIFGGNLASFNAKLHESRLYNIFQFGVSALAAFTGGMASTMSCFVAGTMVLTANGLIAIENIKAGDKVISTDPETGVTEEKNVLDAFNRQVTELVHVRIGDEVITTTYDHPFYVERKGFVNAVKLQTGDILLDSNKKRFVIKNVVFESSEIPIVVYNLKVEDYHTYYVSELSLFVHNGDCAPRRPVKDVKKIEQHEDGSISYTKIINGREVTVTYSSDGYPDFSPFAHPEHPNPVEIEYTGNRARDFAAANKAAGLKSTPKGYTWHHMEDGKSMILVDEVVHGSTYGFPHTGGFSINQVTTK